MDKICKLLAFIGAIEIAFGLVGLLEQAFDVTENALANDDAAGTLTFLGYIALGAAFATAALLVGGMQCITGALSVLGWILALHTMPSTVFTLVLSLLQRLVTKLKKAMIRNGDEGQGENH